MLVFRSLAFKWIATLLVTSLIGVLLAGVLAYRSTITEYDRLRSEQAEAAFVDDASTFYQIYGTWDGLDAWLRSTQRTDDPRGSVHPPEQFALADAHGVVVLGSGLFRTGMRISSDVLAVGTPVELDGVRVGTALWAEPPPELDPREQRYVDGITRALLAGALGASATAVVIGLLLSRQFLRPLSELTQAIMAMHSGNLDQRVEIRTHDELGLLAQTFNEMSANVARANHLRKQMTADIAHDLRTPLTVIAGYLEALGDGTLKPTPERFRVMSEEVTLLQRLVEDLRTLSLADAGELKLMRAAQPPRDLLERVAASLGANAAAAQVALEVQAADTLPDIVVDGERMVQVLSNLVSNALRHTPAGGRVSLHAAMCPEGIRFEVRDTGSGIAPDDLPRIFDRFYRGDPARQSGSGESGLGLAIAKSIVTAHGGTITAESRPGSGTTLRIVLPLPVQQG